MRPLYLSALMALAASPVFARCPVSDDLGTGIVIEFVGDFREVYRRGDDGTVTVDGLAGGDMTHRLTLLHGAYLQRYVAVQEGEEVPVSASTYAYPEGDAGPMPPVEGARWQGSVPIAEAEVSRDEMQVHEAGAPIRMDIGACAYDVLPLTLTYGEAAEYIETVHFIPALGFGYLSAFQNAGNEPRQQVVLSIAVLEL